MTRRNYGAARPRSVRDFEKCALETLRGSSKQYDSLLEERREDYGWGSLGLLPVIKHRESEALDRANFDTAEDRMRRAARAAYDADPDAEDDGLFVTNYGHWGYGWVRYIFFDTTIVELTDEATAIGAALDVYPVLDEELYSEYEWDDNHPSDTECYSDDPDCSCYVATHDCDQEFTRALGDGEIDTGDELWRCRYCHADYDITWRQWLQIRRHVACSASLSAVRLSREALRRLLGRAFTTEGRGLR